MLLLREPFWLLFLMAFVGILFGRMKGRPGWGFVLGLFLGPVGLALMLLLPASVVRPRGAPQGAQGAQGARAGFTFRAGTAWPSASGRSEGPDSDSGSGCPRCGKHVGRTDKACSHCGNVLMPIKYEVRGPEGA
jgi:hypothetical protein